MDADVARTLTPDQRDRLAVTLRGVLAALDDGRRDGSAAERDAVVAALDALYAAGARRPVVPAEWRAR